MLVGFLTSLAICIGVLFFSLPMECWAVVKMNCRRLDGCFSRRRFRRELSAFWQYATTLALPALLAFLACFVVATFLFSYVIPLDLMVRSFSEFNSDSEAWRRDLQGVQLEHAQFLIQLGFSSTSIFQIQKWLWNDWPEFAAASLLFVIFAVALLAKCAGHAVSTLVTGIRKRRRIYAHSDVRHMQNVSATPTSVGSRLTTD